jgi:carbonic anhydrase
VDKLKAGIARFEHDVFPKGADLFGSLASGQAPRALFLTCADSRVVPNLITQTEPGELFMCRNVGNIVPPHGSVYGGTSATIEYAVAVLHVRHVIVCGHSDCGAMKALLDPTALDGLPDVAGWLQYADPTGSILDVERSDPSAALAELIDRNIAAQLNHLETHPAVRRALDAGDVDLHGWRFDIATGRTWAIDRSTGQFAPIVHD